MFLAHYIHDLSPFVFEIRPGVGIRWYGLSYVLAFLGGYLLFKWLAEKGYSQLSAEKAGDFITWAALCGVLLGGRLGYFLFYQPHLILHDPLAFFRVWDGGMSSHGGMLGLIVVTFVYARIHRISWPGLGDNLCVVAPIGLFLGRVANFINGELYGRPTEAAWGVVFPSELATWPVETRRAVEADLAASHAAAPTLDQAVAMAGSDPVVREILLEYLPARHPSQLYEAVLEGLVLFAILWWMRTKTRQPFGMITGAFFVFYAIFRIMVEFVREPDAPLTWLFTRGQLLSFGLIAIGLAFMIYAVARGGQGRNLPAFRKSKG